MRSTRLPLIVTWLSTAVATGCGTSSGAGDNSGATDGGASISPEAFAAVFGEAICMEVYRCCTEADRLSMGILSQPSCSGVSSTTFAAMGSLKDAVDENRAVFDGAKARACVNSLKTAACYGDAPFDNPKTASTDCAAAIIGHVAIGGACKSAWDCTGTASCLPGVGASDGKCVGNGKDGDGCAVSSDCQHGFYCGSNTRKCAPKKPDGADCYKNDECAGETCMGESRCVTAKICAGST